jgi:hypothetical protein
MKFILGFCSLLLLGAGNLLAQVGGGALSNQPQIFDIPSHPERASRQALAQEQSLLDPSTTTSAKGERPLWDVPKQQVTYVMPLGDVARFYRKQHEVAKKAVLVKEN